MATQLSIARQLDLSKATVSRILSGHTSHDDATRARVLALASQLGYRHLRPTVRQRAARGAGSTVIGVTLEVGDDLPAETPAVILRALRGVSSAARMENVAVRVDHFPVRERPRLPAHELALWQERRLAGLILAGVFTPEVIRELTRKVPCVRLNHRESNVPVDCVGQNDADAVELLAAHLCALGHRRIGFLGGPEDEWPARARRAGYLAAMTARALRTEMPAVPQTAEADTPAARARCHRRVLEKVRGGVRAWICYHDGVGYALMAALRADGLRVPADVSVCAFDNLKPPGAGLPKLASIEWPFEDIGAAAARRLLRRIQEPAAPPVYLQLNGRLAAGRSTGRCPAAG